MRPFPATSPRPGLAGGVGSLALHAALLAAVLTAAGGPVVTVPAERVIEVALVPALETAAPAPAAASPASAEPPSPVPVSPVPAAAVPHRPAVLTPPPRRVARPVPAAAPAPAPAAIAPPVAADNPAVAAPTAGAPAAGEGAETGAEATAGQPQRDANGSGLGNVGTGTVAGEGGGGRTEVAPLDTPPPSYPLSARRRGIEGRVELRLAIDASGRTVSVALARSSGFDSLDAAALEAAAGWRFHPARRGGSPVASELRVPIRFQLTGIVLAHGE